MHQINDIVHCEDLVKTNTNLNVPIKIYYTMLDRNISSYFIPSPGDRFLVYDYNTVGGYLALNLMCVKTKQCYVTACVADWRHFKKVL